MSISAENKWVNKVDDVDDALAEGDGNLNQAFEGIYGELELKAYTSEIPTKTSDLENDSNYAKKSEIPNVSNFITKSVNDLTNYYLKTETYTQAEVNQMISSIPKFAIEVVEALPTSNISPTTIYLLTSGGEEQNLYTEYIYVNDSWEKLGTQTLDLSGYYTKQEVDQKTAYASETQKGTARIWTTTEDDIVTLNIATEDNSNEA